MDIWNPQHGRLFQKASPTLEPQKDSVKVPTSATNTCVMALNAKKLYEGLLLPTTLLP